MSTEIYHTYSSHFIPKVFTFKKTPEHILGGLQVLVSVEDFDSLKEMSEQWLNHECQPINQHVENSMTGHKTHKIHHHLDADPLTPHHRDLPQVLPVWPVQRAQDLRPKQFQHSPEMIERLQAAPQQYLDTPQQTALFGSGLAQTAALSKILIQDTRNLMFE